MAVVVSYPGVMPAATQVALAFHQSMRLSRYETTFVYDDQNPAWRGLCGLLGPTRGERLRRQLSRRGLPELPGHLVHQHALREIVRTASSLIGANDAITDRIWEWMILEFDRSVAASLKREVTAVYGYEHSCHDSFARAHELGAKTILDMASPHYSFIGRMLEEEIRKNPEVETDHYRATQPLAEERNARKQREFDRADLVIANSKFTASTLEATGYDPNRIGVVPLAAPPVNGSWRTLNADLATRFFFAGTVSIRKGGTHLLRAWELLGRKADATLTIAGAWSLPRAQLQRLPAGIEYLGSIPQSELFGRYLQSSVLVFPSVCDGFAMVVTEAMAHGLPVITTRSVGASDLVEEGVNGWVVEPGDAEGLAERMEWCISHPAELSQMREAAEATAARNQWSDYRRRLLRTIDEKLPGATA